MQYEGPAYRSDEEILAILETTDAEPADRISAVLSAIFYGSTLEFAGDALIHEFAHAEYKERVNLTVLFETFYQACRTTYRIDDSIALLERYKAENRKDAGAIAETIQALREYKAIFGNS